MAVNRFFGEDADEGKVAVALIVIQTVTDDELVGNLKADVIGA